MATLTALSVIERVQTILQDTTSIRWTNDELLKWLNDAQRHIVLLKPDANPVVATVDLATGTKQEIPSDGTQFIDATRNMGTTGDVKVGNSITYIRRNILDEQNPNWHNNITVEAVKHFTFDNRNPKVYYVYPAVVSPGTNLYRKIEIHYAAAPAECTTSPSSYLSLGDIYANPIMDWMLYRSYSKDADYAANEQRAGAALKRFYDALQLKSTAEDAFDPDRPPQARVVQSNN